MTGTPVAICHSFSILCLGGTVSLICPLVSQYGSTCVVLRCTLLVAGTTPIPSKQHHQQDTTNKQMKKRTNKGTKKPKHWVERWAADMIYVSRLAITIAQIGINAVRLDRKTS